MAAAHPVDEDHVEDPSKELMRVVTKHNLTDRSLRDISLLLNSHHNDHENIPTTKKTYLKNLGLGDDFMTLKMCIGCKKLYPGEIPEVCRNTRYDGSICNEQKSDQDTHMAYRTIGKGIEGLVHRHDNFNALINKWRQRDSGPYITDVHDGSKWNELLPWLNEEGYSSLLLQFNIDWLNPFRDIKYSLGVMFMTILNLPRDIRHLEENVLTIGVIPGPDEPAQGSLNEIMEVMALDLMNAEELDIGNNKYRVRLFNCASDIPATRAAMGLSGHSAKQGCSKCDSDIRADACHVGRTRTHIDHVRAAGLIKLAKNKTEIEQISKSTGYKDSPMLNLPHFRPVEDHVVDAMHNLCSGIPKRLITLSDIDHSVLATNLKSAEAPETLANRIRNSRGLTASQYKTLIMNYTHCFHGSVSLRKLEMFNLLKSITMILISRCVTELDLEKADAMVKEFLPMVKGMLSDSALSVNFHMLIHISEDIRRFGPCYNNWCFPYERYNRTIKNINTNNHDIALQIMRRTINAKRLAHITKSETHRSLPPVQRDHLQIARPLMTSAGHNLRFLPRKKLVPTPVKAAVYNYITNGSSKPRTILMKKTMNAGEGSRSRPEKSATNIPRVSKTIGLQQRTPSTGKENGEIRRSKDRSLTPPPIEANVSASKAKKSVSFNHCNESQTPTVSQSPIVTSTPHCTETRSVSPLTPSSTPGTSGARSFITTPVSKATDSLEHMTCDAKIRELHHTIQKNAVIKKSMSKEGHKLARTVYSSIHLQYSSVEAFTSKHNQEVTLLLVKGLLSLGYVQDDCIKLARLSFRREKEKERPRTQREKKQRSINNRKVKKLDRRQRRQLPNEKALYPLCFELMSSSDEEDDEGIRRKLNFIADDMQDHISELDRRIGEKIQKREVPSTRRASLKLNLNSPGILKSAI